MALLSGWPTLVDDSGDGQSGTVLDKSVFDGIKAEIEDQVHSTTNTTIKPKAITDEVVTARGNMTDLNDRLDGVIDADGALITPASIVSSSQLQNAVGGVNLIKNDTFLIWPDGDASVPAYWTNPSGTPTIDRAGTGQSDTTRKVGPYCLSVTNTGIVRQLIMDTGVWSNWDHVEGQYISMGCWVKSSIASHARIMITDAGSSTWSSYHTGGGTWEWLTVSHLISATATSISLGLQVEQNGTAYYSGPTAVFGAFAPDEWRPAPKAYGTLVFTFAGAPSTGDDQRRFVFQRPALIKDIQAVSSTAASGSGLIVDIEVYDGASWTSIFSGAKTIIASGNAAGSVRPDGGYAYRCVQGYSGVGPFDNNSLMRVNIDGATGVTNVSLQVRCLQWLNPIEDVLEYNDLQ